MAPIETPQLGREPHVHGNRTEIKGKKKKNEKGRPPEKKEESGIGNGGKKKKRRKRWIVKMRKRSLKKRK